MNWKTKLRQEIAFRRNIAESWRSHESVLLEALKDVRRFYAELIADSVLECVDGADKYGPTVEVDEITSEVWLEAYRFCNKAIDWICGY